MNVRAFTYRRTDSYQLTTHSMEDIYVVVYNNVQTMTIYNFTDQGVHLQEQ
jgi:hypothetical protein